MPVLNQIGALIASASDDYDALLFQYGIESAPIDQIDRDQLDQLETLAAWDADNA